MPQYIDPNTGFRGGGGDGMAGDPYVGTPNTIPGMTGLTAARRVSGASDLRPFEYLRNQGGSFYAQDSRSDPTEGAPAGGGEPLPPGITPPHVDSVQSMTGQPPQQQGIGGGMPPQFLQMMRMLSGGIGWDGQDPYGSAGYGQANNVPNAYGGGMGGGIGYQGGQGGGWGRQRQPRQMGAFTPEQNRLARPSGIGAPNSYQTTLSGGSNRGGYAFRWGGRV